MSLPVNDNANKWKQKFVQYLNEFNRIHGVGNSKQFLLNVFTAIENLLNEKFKLSDDNTYESHFANHNLE